MLLLVTSDHLTIQAINTQSMHINKKPRITAHIINALHIHSLTTLLDIGMESLFSCDSSWHWSKNLLEKCHRCWSIDLDPYIMTVWKDLSAQHPWCDSCSSTSKHALLDLDLVTEDSLSLVNSVSLLRNPVELTQSLWFVLLEVASQGNLNGLLKDGHDQSQWNVTTGLKSVSSLNQHKSEPLIQGRLDPYPNVEAEIETCQIRQSSLCVTIVQFSQVQANCSFSILFLSWPIHHWCALLLTALLSWPISCFWSAGRLVSTTKSQWYTEQYLKRF